MWIRFTPGSQRKTINGPEGRACIGFAPVVRVAVDGKLQGRKDGDALFATPYEAALFAWAAAMHASAVISSDALVDAPKVKEPLLLTYAGEFAQRPWLHADDMALAAVNAAPREVV